MFFFPPNLLLKDSNRVMRNNPIVMFSTCIFTITIYSNFDWNTFQVQLFFWVSNVIMMIYSRSSSLTHSSSSYPSTDTSFSWLPWTSRPTLRCWWPGARTGTSRSGALTLATATSLSLPTTTLLRDSGSFGLIHNRYQEDGSGSIFFLATDANIKICRFPLKISYKTMYFKNSFFI